jgi:DNA-binding response OmpR family regulator
MALGAVDYILKPARSETVMARVAELSGSPRS